MTTNDFEKNAKKASAFSSAVSPSSKRRRRGRNDKMLGFSSFLWVALCCVFLASWAPTSAHAAAKAITWTFSAQTVTMLTTDTLTISWSNTHDVYYSTTGTCSGGTSKAASSPSGSYTTTIGEMDVGTHYFYCSIGSHCSSGMYVTVNVTKGNSAILNPSDVTYTATDINGATKAADWQTDCSWGGTGSCGAGYCTDMSTKPKCDANQLKSPNVAATSIDSAEELAKYTAQTCTQADSTVDERCGATWLNTWMSAGRLGTGGAVAAYCNDKYLVIIGTGATGFTTNMADISQAPGGTYYPDGTTATDCVTSEVTVSSPKMETTAIPLKTGDYRYTLLDTALGSNNFDTFSEGAGDGKYKYLCDTDTEGCFGLPSWTGVGVSTTGQSIYPLYSNVVRITLDACEVDSCNEHVGQGGGQPHLHGDPFHASDTMCHYGPANYTDGTDGHPPVIGFAYDGPTIYGRYLSTSAPGFSDGLDDCGGHEHSADLTAYGGYHYHAQVISATTSSANKGVPANKIANTGKTYPAFTPGPYKCFRGDLSKRGDAAYSYWNTNVPVQDTKPCNGMTHYWVKPGFSIPGAGTLAVTLATCDATSAPTNGAIGDCTSTLASGSTCQPTCNAGYTVSGTSSCTLGTLTAATCSANPCDASAPPANGAVGDCTSTLASGSTCQPTCNTGYTVSGTSSCLAETFTTAECSVAPSPPPPSPPPPAAAAVQAEMQLTGYSAAEFDDDKKTNFKTGMAKYLGVDSAAITITSVVDVTAGRRKLSAVDSVLKVEFTVEATTFSDTTALETKLVVTDVTTMKTELISAGLAVSNIVAPTTITALAPPPSPPPSPPPPASTSPLLSVVKLIAATAALAFFAC